MASDDRGLPVLMHMRHPGGGGVAFTAAAVDLNANADDLKAWYQGALALAAT